MIIIIARTKYEINSITMIGLISIQLIYFAELVIMLIQRILMYKKDEIIANNSHIKSGRRNIPGVQLVKTSSTISDDVFHKRSSIISSKDTKETYFNTYVTSLYTSTIRVRGSFFSDDGGDNRKESLMSSMISSEREESLIDFE